MNRNIAIVTFVKTIGYSPLKTRLARVIGKKMAEEFYLLSCQAMEEICSQLQNINNYDITRYWAVAEEKALDAKVWKQFGKIYQGTGSLGERLAYVHEALRNSYEGIIFLGADSPQIEADDLRMAINAIMEQKAIAVGPSIDGGFWLWGSGKKLESHFWKNIQYSSASTLKELRASLQAEAPIFSLRTLRDVDHLEDLLALRDLFLNNENLLPSQRNLLSWIRANCGQ